MKKLDALTTTRFFAAITVLFFHGGAGLFPLNLYPITPLFTSGTVFVSYFFVLSGFILAYVYYRPQENFRFGYFWSARFARIYPVYLFSFGLVSLYYIDIITRIKPQKIWASILLVQAWIPKYALSFNIAAWSLSVEAFFYIIFPFLILWAYRQNFRKLATTSLALWAASQIIHIYLLNSLGTESKHFLSYYPLFHLNAFLIGVVGGIWFQKKTSDQAIQQKKNARLFWISILFTASIILWDYQQTKMGNATIRLSLDNGILAPVFLLTIITLALDETKLSKILSHPWLVLLGEASYVLYIVHIPIRWSLEKIVETNGINIPYTLLYYSYVPLVIAFSILVHKQIEKPARAWLQSEFEQGLKGSRALLLFSDGLIVLLAVKLSFWLRLGNTMQLEFYAPAASLMLFSAFIIRLFSLHIWDEKTGYSPYFSRTALGSLVIAAIMFMAQGFGWIDGFPKTVLLIEYLLFSGVTGLLRYRAGYYSSND